MKGLKQHIRSIPDFPKKGILFYDVTTLLNNKNKFKEVMDVLYERYIEKDIDAIVAIEARGFIFGAALANKLGAAFAPIRKKGKLPYSTSSVTYSLEYGEDTIEIHEDAFKPGAKVLIVDDLLATGGTMAAAVELVKKLKGDIVEVSFVIELSDLKGRDKLKGLPVYSMVKY
ncbi:MAG: adenine phosphoribosyltransferase [Candidatus Omnitrophica bacterium]|nr:adenine phosphoribosyltransferase [Candidatus Omnitrophota bacterium]